jgi:hypothetical protein
MTSWPGSAIEKLPGGGVRFSLTEPQITYLRIDYQARIQFGEAELVIEAPFELTVSSIQTTEAGMAPSLPSIPTRPETF